MPIRFPTEAANDPGIRHPARDDAQPAPDLGADGTPRGRADGTPEPPERTSRDRGPAGQPPSRDR